MNTLYCSLVLLAQKLQVFVFGELRPVELQRVKDKFWNYAFYKFCFLFGVLGVESVNELSLWISWFFSLAFALVFCQLIKDRFELVSVQLHTDMHRLSSSLAVDRVDIHASTIVDADALPAARHTLHLPGPVRHLCARGLEVRRRIDLLLHAGGD